MYLPTYPVQIVWGANDPALKLAVHGEIARRAAGLALPPGGPGTRARRAHCPPREVLNRSPDAIRRIGIATTARSVRKDRGVFEMASPISRCEFIALSHLLRRVGA